MSEYSIRREFCQRQKRPFYLFKRTFRLLSMMKSMDFRYFWHRLIPHPLPFRRWIWTGMKWRWCSLPLSEWWGGETADKGTTRGPIRSLCNENIHSMPRKWMVRKSRRLEIDRFCGSIKTYKVMAPRCKLVYNPQLYSYSFPINHRIHQVMCVNWAMNNGGLTVFGRCLEESRPH